MSTPPVQVFVGFQTSVGFGSPFQLNNATLGVLDTSTLGGVVLTDLTEYVESVSTNLGRNRQLDQFNAGTATVVFNNRSRILDPLNTVSPFYPNVIPRSPVVISSEGTPIYSGLITDWNVDYDINNNDIMVASCVDNFVVLGNQKLNAHTPALESSSSRINSILSRPEVSYQGPRNILTGTSTLGAFPIDQDTNVLTYLQSVAESEQGYLYITRRGVLRFAGRRINLPQSGVVFSDTGTGVRYQTLINQFGDELLYNYIVTQSPAGAAQINSDATSIALYQSQVLSLTDLLNSSVSEVNDLGAYLLGRYKDPALRFTGLTVQLAGMSKADQDACLSLALTAVATITKSFEVGSPLTVTQDVICSGIAHNIVPGSHTITFSFESVDSNSYLTLDDPVFGKLDANLLAF